ncbi:hypothetical protein KUTeg_006399 [Tegillarca granosa]|uniref:Uncharacterized protein n=1 Tax=Tegillarca granosa TaxID=220873 RepID=A0ABQ9FGG1_TEGGR|nr:hypothetical protein KUTeg_006399 [Tegillarca granosa]
MDTGYPPAMFDTNRSLTPFFGLPPQNLSPPSRNIQNEGPLFPGNFFGASSRPLSNSSSVPKNAEISAPFNSLFPPSRPPQNGLGLNFQHGFGMNHGGMSSGTQITPHSNSVTVTPHMSNFSLTNIFSDVGNSQNDSMNMSPIKFPHSNPILPPQGMDPNSLQHPHHQSSSLYHHNRGPHPPPPVIHTAMSINSILGHNHHGFDTRPMPRAMNTSAPPFGGHGHPPPTFGMPPLDFSMHEH